MQHFANYLYAKVEIYVFKLKSVIKCLLIKLLT